MDELSSSLPMTTAASMTRILFRRVFWCLVAPCFFLAHRAWKQSASFYYYNGGEAASLGVVDHPPRPVASAVTKQGSLPIQIQQRLQQQQQSTPPTPKPRWVFFWLAPTDDDVTLPTPGRPFVPWQPPFSCITEFIQLYNHHGRQPPATAALQLDCVRQWVAHPPTAATSSGTVVVPWTIVSCFSSPTHDAMSSRNNNTTTTAQLVFWEQVIQAVSDRWEVVVTRLYEPWFAVLARRLLRRVPQDSTPTPADWGRVQLADDDLPEFPWPRGAVVPNSLPALANSVQVKTSWQEILCLVQCAEREETPMPITTTTEKLPPCPTSPTFLHFLWRQSWRHEIAVLGGAANATRLADQLAHALQLWCRNDHAGGHGHDDYYDEDDRLTEEKIVAWQAQWRANRRGDVGVISEILLGLRISGR